MSESSLIELPQLFSDDDGDDDDDEDCVPEIYEMGRHQLHLGQLIGQVVTGGMS